MAGPKRPETVADEETISAAIILKSNKRERQQLRSNCVLHFINSPDWQRDTHCGSLPLLSRVSVVDGLPRFIKEEEVRCQ